MVELKQVGKHTYYLAGPTNIGFYLENENEVYLIDSGNDKDAGRRIRQILDKNKWNLKAILNTHANADHIGGNKYLQGQTGCKVLAPGIDCQFTKNPILETTFLYGGFPPADLRHKFLLAKESDAEYLTDSNLPSGIEMISLPGHFFDMVGFKTSDDIVFLADCLSSESTLDKYQISFIHDVEAYLNTLERVKEMKAGLFIPSHAEETTDICGLAQKNIDKVNEIAEHILSLCEEPIYFEKILQKLFNDFQLKMSFEQYVLVGSTVRSYLAWLRNKGLLDIIFENNMLLWQKNTSLL